MNQPSISQFGFNNESSFAKKNFVNNFEIETLVNAMNNSSLRQMSKGDHIKPGDMMDILSKAIEQVSRFSMLYEPKAEDLKHYFRIVEINESDLFGSDLSFSFVKSCSLNAKDLKKYQLLITLDGK